MNFDMKKYFYIDEQGNKKKYVGKVIKQPNGTLKGLLTNRIVTSERVQLKLKEKGLSIIDSKPINYYFDDNGIKHIVDMNDNNVVGNKYVISSKETVNLIFNNPIEEKIHYTYVHNKKDVLFTGNIADIKYDETKKIYYIMK